MTTELEAILPGEGLHLRDYYRLSTSAAQASQVGVVDNTLPRDIPPVSQGFMNKALHLEAIEAAVTLQVAPCGVAPPALGSRGGAPGGSRPRVYRALCYHGLAGFY